MSWFVRGDIDGFFGLALDNLVQLLLIDTLCRFVLGFPPELVYGRVLPGAAVSILVGNVFYARPGARSSPQRTGRTDVCALPYGINTVSLFAHVFLVMLPAKALADASRARPIRRAWRGRPACSRRSAPASIELARRVRRRARPQGHAARGAPLHARRHRARLHLARISVPHLRASDRRPDDVRHRDPHLLRPRAVQGTHSRAAWSPSRVGTLLSWVTGIAPVGGHPPARGAAPADARPSTDLIAALGGGHLLPYLSVILAMGALQRPRLAAEHRIGRSRRRRVRDAVVADGERRRQHCRGALRLGVSDDDLHRASRAGRRWARAPAIRF